MNQIVDPTIRRDFAECFYLAISLEDSETEIREHIAQATKVERAVKLVVDGSASLEDMLEMVEDVVPNIDDYCQEIEQSMFNTLVASPSLYRFRGRVSLSDPTDWEFIASLSYVAIVPPPPAPYRRPFIPIPQDSILVTGTTLGIAVSSDSPNIKPHWFRGCSVYLGSEVTVPASFFDSTTQYSRRVHCGLNRLTYCFFPDLGLSEYRLFIDFPRWLADVSVIVNQYSGVVPVPVRVGALDGGIYP